LARFLALDWDHQQLHIVAASIRRGAVHIEKALVWREEQVPNIGNAEELGKLLCERLKEAGIAPAPVLACVGRDRVILKDLRYPAVPDAEEPAVVRFQAVKELTDAPDEVVIDYARIGNGSGQRRALALIARRELVDAYQSLCRAAGLRFAGLTPRSFGIAACVRHLVGSSPLTPAPEPPDADVAVVAIAEHWGEFGVLREDSLLFARSLEPGPGLAGEVRRNLAVYAGQAPQQPIKAVYVAGGSELASVRERLRDMLDVPVHSFDPFAGLERSDLPHAGRGAFAGTVGLLHAWASGQQLPINFIKPREPKPPRDPNQRKLVLGAALAASVLLAAVVYCYMQLSALDRRVADQANRNASLDQLLSKLEEDGKKYKALSEWDRKGIVVLDELYDVVEKFPDTSSIQLTTFAVSPRDDAKDKHVARIALEGILTEDTKLVDRLLDGLGRDAHRRLDITKTDPNMGAMRFSRFRSKFTSFVDVEKPPPNKYTARLPDNLGREDGQGGDQ
jgi:Tfp pilus assembly PilM family ATPase